MLDIKNCVHELYCKEDINCARTMIICLSELFDICLTEQTLLAVKIRRNKNIL